MKKLVISLILSALATGAASAATIAVGRGGSTNGYAVFDGSTNLSAVGGYYIAIGTYAVAPTISDAATFQAAINNFSVFASVLSPTSGATLGSVTGSFVATNAAFNSAPLYFLIGNASTKEASTKFAILKGDPTGFFFPASAGSPSGSGSVTLSGAAVASPIGIAGSETDVAGAPDTLVLSAIPEPSVALLGALGILGLVRRRR
jgi:hypothetical protein